MQSYTTEISGQIGINPQTKKLEEGVKNQTKRIMQTIKNILENQGWSMSNITKARIFLIDMKDYAEMNEVYASYFPNKDYPTRFALAVKELPAGASVEIEVTAAGEEPTK